MPVISIIIPVYNTEKYLINCINSVLNQTINDIEIICIDDGSTDNSANILDDYSRRDNRIKVIHKQNEGFGKTMNLGLKVSTGQYIGFVESDDWILSDMYKTLYNEVYKNDLDYIKTDYYHTWETLSYKEYINLPYDTSNTLEFKNMHFYLNANIGYWTGLYKKTFLSDNKIDFNETKSASYQDNGFWVFTSIFAKRAKYLNTAFYMYRQDNPASSINNKGKMLAGAKEFDYIEESLKNRILNKYLPICNYLRMASHVYTLSRIDDSIKLDFLKYIKSDYLYRKNNIDFSYFQNSDYILNMINKISDDPIEYYMTYIYPTLRIKQQIISTTDKYKNIVIYGIGRRADKIVMSLFNLLLWEKVRCFAVSDNSNITKFRNLPVCSINDLTDHKDDLVLVAVKRDSAAYNEIVDTLNKLNFTNYMDTELFLKL